MIDRRLIAVWLTLGALVPTAARAGEAVSVSGYYKSFVVEYELPTVYVGSLAGEYPPLGSVTNRLRLDVRLRLSNALALTTAYDIGPIVQDNLLFTTPALLATLDPFSYRVDDIDPRLYPSDDNELASFALMQNLDRAYVEIRTAGADFYVGRQPIAWGSARAINPTDILAPYSYETLDTEDRIGVDAVRMRLPLGPISELDAGLVFGREFNADNNAAFLRSRFYVARTDVSLLAVGFRGNLMLGMDLARSIGGAGVWVEAAHTFVDVYGDDELPGMRDYLRATIGADYSLGDNTYGFAEYHFNQPGADDADAYLGRLRQTAFREGATYLMGRHYLIPGVSHQINPLMTGVFELLWNLSDRSVYVAPSLEYNVAANVYLAAGAFVGMGRSPSPSEAVGSEFGFYADTFHGSFRVYF